MQISCRTPPLRTPPCDIWSFSPNHTSTLFSHLCLNQLSCHRTSSSTHSLVDRLRLVIRVCCWALDDFLYCLFNFVPVFGLNTQHSNAKIIGDLHQLSPASLVVDEGDRNADPSETAGATNTVEIGLGIGFATGIVRNILVANQSFWVR